MERGLKMLLHSIIICFILYLFLVFILGQNPILAESRSILIAALILIYMIIFGHKLPSSTSINKTLFTPLHIVKFILFCI